MTVKRKPKAICGLDIGLQGGLTIISENKIVKILPLPTIDVLVNKKIRKQYDIPGVNELVKRLSIQFEIQKVAMERLRAIPNQSSQTAFSLGGGSMLFKTIFIVYGIVFIEIEPKSWQQSVFKELGIQYNGDTTKQASIQAAKRLFPGTSFLRSDRSRVDSDGLTDSALIAYYINKK